MCVKKEYRGQGPTYLSENLRRYVGRSSAHSIDELLHLHSEAEICQFESDTAIFVAVDLGEHSNIYGDRNQIMDPYLVFQKKNHHLY